VREKKKGVACQGSVFAKKQKTSSPSKGRQFKTREGRPAKKGEGGKREGRGPPHSALRKPPVVLGGQKEGKRRQKRVVDARSPGRKKRGSSSQAVSEKEGELSLKRERGTCVAEWSLVDERRGKKNSLLPVERKKT